MKFWLGIIGICVWTVLALSSCTNSQTMSGGSGTNTNKPSESTTTTNTSG